AMLSKISDENVETALRIFQWLLFSARPLYIEELAEIATVDFENDPPNGEGFWDPYDVVKICPGVLTTMEGPVDRISNQSKVSVRLAHISVKEYLMSEEILKGPAAKYWVKETSAHTSIAQFCLEYVPLSKAPFAEADKEFPAAIYAAENWLHHYRQVPDHVESVHRIALDFFLRTKDIYMNWLQFF